MSDTEPVTDDGRAYGGVLGAFPYAFRSSESRLFRSYVVIGGLAAGLATLLFAFSLIGVMATTLRSGSGVFSFTRAFVVFVGFLVVFPTVAPVLSVARRLRRTGSTPAADHAMALAGYGFLASLYVALLVSTPPAQQTAPAGPLALVVGLLYDLPAVAGAVPPTIAAAGIYLLHRRQR